MKAPVPPMTPLRGGKHPRSAMSKKLDGFSEEDGQAIDGDPWATSWSHRDHRHEADRRCWATSPETSITRLIPLTPLVSKSWAANTRPCEIDVMSRALKIG